MGLHGLEQGYLYLLYPLNRRLGGPQSRSGLHGVKKKNSLSSDGNQIPAAQLFAHPYTELSRLLPSSSSRDIWLNVLMFYAPVCKKWKICY
jgi:hypothetical protein